MDTLSTQMRKFGSRPFVLFLGAVIVGTMCLPGCLFHRKRRADLAAAINPGDQPDKILFEKATNEIAHNRFDVGRLTLQTLINTYPDSEYLSKAKLAIADSYYAQGGVSGLTQAEAEYKDFITFFPTAPEAPEAQYRVGMSHFRLMAKSDRDQTEARLAQAEFKEFLLKYPDNPVAIRVKARQREAEEVLAEGEYETASFYLARGAYRASRGRFQDIVDNYPNFSLGDEALYGLAQSYEHLRKPNEAVPYYSRLVRIFPLSPHVDEAKQRLAALHQPIPKPTKATLARAQADATRIRSKSLYEKLTMAMASSPDTSTTLRGPVQLGGPEAGGVELARNTPPALPSAKNTIVAEPVAESSLNSGRAGDPNPSASPSPNPNEKIGEVTSNPAATGNTAKPQEENAPSSAKASEAKDEKNKKKTDPFALPKPPKKKGKLHKLKKVIKPF